MEVAVFREFNPATDTARKMQRRGNLDSNDEKIIHFGSSFNNIYAWTRDLGCSFPTAEHFKASLERRKD